MTQPKTYHKLWMDIAIRVSTESKCQRRKVGAIAVKDDRIISIGWNGTHPGHDNCCENKIYMDHDAGGWLSPEEIYERWPYVEVDPETKLPTIRYRLETKPEVIHAESNMLGKLAGSHESAKNASIYITLAPCLECAKQLAVAKVKEVIYNEEYRGTEGVDHLRKCNIPVFKL